MNPYRIVVTGTDGSESARTPCCAGPGTAPGPPAATSIELRAIVGAPVTVLVELAAEVHAELIVVGTPARRPRRSWRAASRRPNAPTRRPART